MLPWWGWALLWAALLLGGAGVLAWRLRWLWGRSRAFLAALEEAEATLSAVEARAAEVAQADERADRIAPIEDPRELRRAYAAVRATHREARRRRRGERLPGWARRNPHRSHMDPT